MLKHPSPFLRVYLLAWVAVQLTNVEQERPPYKGHDEDASTEGCHSDHDHGNVPQIFGEHKYPQEAGDEDHVPSSVAMADLHGIPT